MSISYQRRVAVAALLFPLALTACSSAPNNSAQPKIAAAATTSAPAPAPAPKLDAKAVLDKLSGST